MVQAVAMLRTKNYSEIAAAVNNLIAMLDADSAYEPYTWKDHTEVLDVYGAFAGVVKEEDRREKARVALGISSEEAS